MPHLSWNSTAGIALALSVAYNWSFKYTISPWRLVVSFTAFWILLLLAWAIWTVWVYPLMIAPERHFPQPSSGNHWLAGQVPASMKVIPGSDMLRWMNEVPHNGMIWFRGLFNQWHIVLCSPEAISEVLVQNSYTFEKPEFLKGHIGRIVGVGIVLLEGDEHRFQRRQLLPAFTYRHIKGLYPMFWDKSCEVVRAMTAEAARTGGDLELLDWASRCTLDIFGVGGLGHDFGAIEDPNNELVKTYSYILKPSKSALALVMLRQFLPGKLVNILPVRQNGDIDAASARIRALCFDIIKTKRAKLAGGEEPELDVLAAALKGDVLTDEIIVRNIMTLIVAGHETSAAALSWAIYCLCKNPEMQVRLRKEVRERLPPIDSDKSITSADIDGMPYLNAVCSEVLRCYPPVPGTIREPNRDIMIQGVMIKKGTRVAIPGYGLNRYQKYWGPDAEEFRPDRWLVNESTPRVDDFDDPLDDVKAAAKATKPAGGGASSPYANLSFLHGPRSCIGQSFARAELACLVAAWVGRFDFTLKDEGDIGWTTGFTLKPGRNGLFVKANVIGGF